VGGYFKLDSTSGSGLLEREGRVDLDLGAGRRGVCRIVRDGAGEGALNDCGSKGGTERKRIAKMRSRGPKSGNNGGVWGWGLGSHVD